MAKTLLEVKNLKKYFPVRGGILRRKIADVHAVDDVSFSIEAGKTLGIVGESGCGKSTLGKTLLQLYKATSGHVLFDGVHEGARDRQAAGQSSSRETGRRVGTGAHRHRDARERPDRRRSGRAESEGKSPVSR